MRLYRIQIDIFEAATGYAYPIVTHVFQGRTSKEAEGYHEAHRRSDAFLKDCEDKQLFAGNVRCRAVRREGWTEVR